MVSEAELVVAAWGSARLSDDARKIADWIGSIEKTHWLGFNKDGSPKHPLYVSRVDVPAPPAPIRVKRVGNCSPCAC